MRPNCLLPQITLFLITLVDSRGVDCQGTASECGRPVVISEPPRVRENAVPEDADHGVWPWMAALHLNAPSPTQSHFCDGVLIGDNHVLTAAHCIDSKLSSEVRVHLGSHFTNLRLPGEQVIEAEEICVHKRFRSGQEMYDIAVIKLKEAATFSHTVQPICLPETHAELPDNTQLYAAGWGSGKECENCSQAKTLKQMTTSSIANRRCLDYFNKTADPSIMCAYVKDVPSIFGDTGSPVVGYCAPTHWVVYGIVSDGPRRDGFEHLPLITTKVSHYTQTFIYPYMDAMSPSQVQRICASRR
ncbi:chymotrypsin-C-like isoform X1 [Dermacentor andersoni]|uniref:chymotrypsin-C-like isoform X1 n=1 Tax=Dermacentor andersoni TaxID=34620 RepID=UPI003B3B7A92